MIRQSDRTRRANESRAESMMVSLALARTHASTLRMWKCSITPADIRTGREYERAAILAAEREAARGRA